MPAVQDTRLPMRYSQPPYRSALPTKGLQAFSHFRTTSIHISSTPHRHPACLEFCCVVQGVRHRYAGGDARAVCPGELFLAFPNELHGAAGPHSPCEFYLFRIDLSLQGNLLGLGSQGSRQLFSLLRGLGSRHYKLEPLHLRLLEQCHACLERNTEPDLHRALSCLCCFLFSLSDCAAIPVPPPPAAAEDTHIRRALDHIALHLRECLPLKLLAESSGYSPSHFQVVFKRVTGMTPLDYVTLLRVQRACSLLLHSRLRVGEVALECGFSSGNYFSGVFRRFTGCTPRQYRLHPPPEPHIPALDGTPS